MWLGWIEPSRQENSSLSDSLILAGIDLVVNCVYLKIPEASRHRDFDRCIPPRKINMEHNHGGLEDHFPFSMGDL